MKQPLQQQKKSGPEPDVGEEATMLFLVPFRSQSMSSGPIILTSGIDRDIL
jgi:hypothetical protein